MVLVRFEFRFLLFEKNVMPGNHDWMLWHDFPAESPQNVSVGEKNYVSNISFVSVC